MIYKYPLKLTDSQELILPKNAQILSVQSQRKIICVWALVDSNEKKSDVHIIRIYGTGSQHIPASSLRFMSTVQVDEYVWHVFEEIL